MKNNRMMATMSGIQMDEQRMTSLDIAEVTGKQHKDVLKAIRTWGLHGKRYVSANLRLHRNPL